MSNWKMGWHTFTALDWYDETIKFLFGFVARTSEILLAAGLIVSTANFLTDGGVMGGNPGLADAWAWAQALAIDSSLGITFYYVFQCIKHRDWIKAVLYGLLTLLLAIVAGTITNIDTYSHAQHISIGLATAQVGIPVWLLTLLRAIAVVGFVMMSRLKQVSFRDLYQSTEQVTQMQSPVMPTLEEVVAQVLPHLDTLYQTRLETVMERTIERVSVSVEEQVLAQLPERITTSMQAIARPVPAVVSATRISREDEATAESRIRAILRETPDVSIRKLAEQAACVPNTASKWKKRIADESKRA